MMTKRLKICRLGPAALVFKYSSILSHKIASEQNGH